MLSRVEGALPRGARTSTDLLLVLSPAIRAPTAGGVRIIAPGWRMPGERGRGITAPLPIPSRWRVVGDRGIRRVRPLLLGLRHGYCR